MSLPEGQHSSGSVLDRASDKAHSPLRRKPSYDDGTIRARDAINSEGILGAPPLIKAKLLLEMCIKAEYRHGQQYRSFAKELIVHTHGQDCHQLKREMCYLGANHNFVSVVYEFLNREEDREEVLQHLREQVPLIKLPTNRDATIVLSDVDDTLFQSSALMGGPKYPSKAKFPGVEKLYMEVAWKVVFITARPTVMKAMTLAEFRKKLVIPNIGILCGRTADLVWAALDRQKAWEKMAEQKFYNFTMISNVYPECRFVWFGDSGQGDLETGRRMIEQKPEQIVAVFIHDVVESKGVTPKTSAMARTVLQTLGILHIDTYLDAALHLQNKGHLSLQSLFRVAFAVAEDWKELSTKGKWISEAVRTARAKEIMGDLEAVNLVLLKHGMATVTVDGTSLPEQLTPRISPRRKRDIMEEARVDSLSSLEQLKLRAKTDDLRGYVPPTRSRSSSRSSSPTVSRHSNKAVGSTESKQRQLPGDAMHTIRNKSIETKVTPANSKESGGRPSMKRDDSHVSINFEDEDEDGRRDTGGDEDGHEDESQSQSQSQSLSEESRRGALARNASHFELGDGMFGLNPSENGPPGLVKRVSLVETSTKISVEW